MAGCDSGCSNISIMQLFHELKQKFPAVPDRVVSESIRQNAHDREACEAILRRENQGYLLHSYPIALKMSAEPAHNPPALCDQTFVSGVSRSDVSVPNQQSSNFEFVTNVTDDGDATYSQRDRTVSVMTYNSGEERRDNYAVNVNYSTSPSTRVRSALQVSPSPHYICVPHQQARSYTSVNLTLRPPSSEPQPPIDIRSAGSSLTYSTCSYDPRQGFQSQLQICIGPGGVGSVSALRTHAPPVHTCYSAAFGGREQEEERPQLFAPVLLQQQLERKNKLQQELRKERENLRAMQREVQEMRKDLEQRQQRKQAVSLPIMSSLQKVQELRVEIQRLQEECKRMTQEVDLKLDARVPLGETDEEFYKNIYTGQQGFIFPPSSHLPPSRPADSAEGPHWTCSQCTFQNHPLLDKCETCEMPRILIGTDTCYCHSTSSKTCPPSSLVNLPVMHVKRVPSAKLA
ncbi:TGF-beta-activated kinase 1 and MAP3K7-binding protein 3-like isoform X2 [Zootermopsis nevadensis]|uniref:TGF-beta-activated kinase 1 and MAP3K7-binding protein 3-like isoform X2 n=1 Tax=Zootermopsis nevadensis TaxID=136037 RepID=UPI000B8E7799|nr:TGF-beta-activated kinase 1 and MAP3K7-binding protein 3-like isoform X2 [Zootermopsis nevadensis]